MCCCFACAATVVGVRAAYVVVTYVVLSILCWHLSYAAPAATVVALSAVVIACGVALRYAAALVSTHVLGMLLQGLLLSCVQLLSAIAACAIVAQSMAFASDVTIMCACVLCRCSCYFCCLGCYCCCTFRLGCHC